MKKRILSLFFIVCLMFTFATSVYAEGELKSIDFLLGTSSDTSVDYIDLSASDIGDDTDVYFNVWVKESNPDYLVSLHDNESNKEIAMKNFTQSTFGNSFKNVLEKGKSYKVVIVNLGGSPISGVFSVKTY